MLLTSPYMSAHPHQTPTATVLHSPNPTGRTFMHQLSTSSPANLNSTSKGNGPIPPIGICPPCQGSHGCGALLMEELSKPTRRCCVRNGCSPLHATPRVGRGITPPPAEPRHDPGVRGAEWGHSSRAHHPRAMVGDLDSSRRAAGSEGSLSSTARVSVQDLPTSWACSPAPPLTCMQEQQSTNNTHTTNPHHGLALRNKLVLIQLIILSTCQFAHPCRQRNSPAQQCVRTCW
jgi:hypothetical protein